jgi:hypothetical protein
MLDRRLNVRYDWEGKEEMDGNENMYQSLNYVKQQTGKCKSDLRSMTTFGRLKMTKK